jgi:orotate phosphoribosyltransferase
MEQVIARKTAEALLQINAIKLNAAQPFTWASGLRAPIYCDNRQILSFPDARQMVSEYLAWLVQNSFPAASVVAGVATGAIAHGVLVAEKLGKPFVYVRSAPKGHGLSNQVEGRLQRGDQVVVVEDLVSTGKSSLEAVQALREAGAVVLGMVAIFSYELPVAAEAFREADCSLYCLCDYSSLLNVARSGDRIPASDYKILKEWKNDPVAWSEKYQ